MRDLAPVRRPDGKIYRPRKIRAVLLNIDDFQGDMSCLVLGTHDIETARQSAAVEIRSYDTGLCPGGATSPSAGRRARA